MQSCQDPVWNSNLNLNFRFSQHQAVKKALIAQVVSTVEPQYLAAVCNQQTGRLDSHLSMSKWDRLIPHAVFTLNLRCSSYLHLSLSAYASLFGNYDHNCLPIAPPGTIVVAHNPAETCASFAHHGRVRWYIGPAPEHYICHCICLPDMMVECCAQSGFFREKTPFPAISLTD